MNANTARTIRSVVEVVGVLAAVILLVRGLVLIAAAIVVVLLVVAFVTASRKMRHRDAHIGPRP